MDGAHVFVSFIWIQRRGVVTQPPNRKINLHALAVTSNMRFSNNLQHTLTVLVPRQHAELSFGLKFASQRWAVSGDVSKSDDVIIGATFEADQKPKAPSTTGTDFLNERMLEGSQEQKWSKSNFSTCSLQYLAQGRVFSRHPRRWLPATRALCPLAATQGNALAPPQQLPQFV